MGVLVLEHIARFIRASAAPSLEADPVNSATEIAMDTTSGTLKYAVRDAVKEVVDTTSPQTITGAKTFTGGMAGLRRTVTVDAATAVTLTAIQSGLVFISLARSLAAFTLPLAASAPGAVFTLVVGAGADGGEIRIAPSGGDLIITKSSAGADGKALSTTPPSGRLVNTALTNVVGDHITVVSDGLTTWYGISQGGIWAAI